MNIWLHYDFQFIQILNRLEIDWFLIALNSIKMTKEPTEKFKFAWYLEKAEFLVKSVNHALQNYVSYYHDEQMSRGTQLIAFYVCCQSCNQISKKIFTPLIPYTGCLALLWNSDNEQR